MRARECAEDYPTVHLGTSALQAALLLVERDLPGLIVVDDNEHPQAVLSGARLLNSIVPGYVRDDPTLARVVDEEHADRLCARLANLTAKDLLPDPKLPLPVVDADATAIEIAALMARSHTPLVAVVESEDDRRSPMIGAITVARLFSHLLRAGGTVPGGHGAGEPAGEGHPPRVP